MTEIKHLPVCTNQGLISPTHVGGVRLFKWFERHFLMRKVTGSIPVIATVSSVSSHVAFQYVLEIIIGVSGAVIVLKPCSNLFEFAHHFLIKIKQKVTFKSKNIDKGYWMTACYLR